MLLGAALPITPAGGLLSSTTPAGGRPCPPPDFCDCSGGSGRNDEKSGVSVVVVADGMNGRSGGGPVKTGWTSCG